jgi:UDP-N-acetylmuramoyl-L-alanyl-D-glutamate--2,6-diaminopimelate ligase
LPGRFNVANALAAAALATTAGLSLEVIVAGLEQATLPPGRLERVERGQPFGVVVDYAHTMNAFRSVLATLRESTPPPRRLIAVFGATGDRDHAKRPVLAQVAREFADFFVVTDEDPYGERPESIIDEVVAGLPREEEGRRYAREDDRGRAIELALRRARPGDTVVILGKGHEQSMVVNGQKKPWSDVAAASAALEGRS